MGAAGQPDAVDIVFARPGESLDVIELQRLRRAAPAAALVYERAASAVALVDRALDRVGNVARRRRLGRLGARRSWTRIADLLSLPGRHARCRPRPAPHPEPLLLHLLDEKFERPLDDRRHVSVRYPMAQQVLRLPQLVAQRPAGRELHLERLPAERRHHGSVVRHDRLRHSKRKLVDKRRLLSWRACRSRLCRPLRTRGHGSPLHHRTLRQLADHDRHRRQRRKTRHQLLDLPLRLAGRLRQDGLMVVVVEVRGEQPQPSQVHPPGPRRFDHRRKPAPRARHRDPVVGGVLRKTELAHAEGEHRWVRASQVQLPLIDLAQVHQQLGFDAVGFPHELARRREKVRAAHGLERDTCIHHADHRGTAP